MKERNIAVVVFTDRNNNILVQDRKGISKVGEIYGFFGGQIENGETPLQALKRELKEELNYSPKNLKYIGLFPYKSNYEGKYKDWTINQYVFISPITEELLKSPIYEGEGKINLSLQEAIKGIGFPEGSTYFLKKFLT